MIPRELKEALSEKKDPNLFIATSDLSGNPNGASKLLLQFDDNFLYVLDYPCWKTWENLSMNPKICVSFVDDENLKCFKAMGQVQMIESGPEHDKLAEYIHKKLTQITVSRVIEGLHRGKAYRTFVTDISKNFVVYKVKVQKVEVASFEGAADQM